MGDGVLTGPVSRRCKRKAGGVAIDGEAVGRRLKSPSLLRRFCAVEAGLLEAQPAPGEAGGKDVEGDVGGIFLMMAEGGDGVFGGGQPVWVGGRADGGIADGCGVEAEKRMPAEAQIVESG